MKLVKLANFEPVKKPMKYGTWPTFLDVVGALVIV